MSELERLKKRIDESGPEGILTKHVREDFEPAGDLMMRGLLDSGEYIQRKVAAGTFNYEWRIFNSEWRDML